VRAVPLNRSPALRNVRINREVRFNQPRAKTKAAAGQVEVSYWEQQPGSRWGWTEAVTLDREAARELYARLQQQGYAPVNPLNR
jgi:hypothetical protein